jgi:hypothetical protein
MSEINIKAIVTSQANYKKTLNALLLKNPQSSFTAQDVNIAGQSLSRLADYGVLKVVDKKEGFIPIDEDEGTFRRVFINVYEINCDILELLRNYEGYKKALEADKIKARIKKLESLLRDTQEQLKAFQ